jgi:hypothetical protein
MQTSAGYPLEEYRKVQNFRKSVIAHHQIRECLGDYDKKFEDPLHHTYLAITTFVSTHLPNIRASAGLSSSATTAKAFQVTGTDIPATPNMSMTEIQHAYAALEHKFKSLQGQKRNGTGRSRIGKKARGDHEPQELISKETCKCYCHAHGYQNSHNSDQCKVMANQPQNFNAEMRRAKDPTHPAGGSTAVKGRRGDESVRASALTVQATGFMVNDDHSAPRPLRREMQPSSRLPP